VASTTKTGLAVRGQDLIIRFCQVNRIKLPAIHCEVPHAFNRWQGCGLYHRGNIYVDAARCALPGHAGPAWSWPGYIVDRTPYGVHAHELGHYVDDLHGGVASRVRRASGEERLTSYCPNNQEWFAEMMRLFTTNHTLLRAIRPATHAQLILLGLKPCETRSWRRVLQGAPARTLAIAERRVAQGK
jgi:hypothetical protein